MSLDLVLLELYGWTRNDNSSI